MSVKIVRLRPGDDALFDDMLALFAAAFDEAETYLGAPPSPTYRDGLLADEGFVALIAAEEETVTGALVGYELRKFECDLPL